MKYSSQYEIYELHNPGDIEQMRRYGIDESTIKTIVRQFHPKAESLEDVIRRIVREELDRC